MTSTLHNQNYSYFLTEAQDLLQTIEQGMFSLRSERTPAKVHELMRAAHTLKGAAASVGLSAINNVAHVLEDIFRTFYNPQTTLDTEIEGLLFEGYECLRLLLTAQFNGTHVDESEVLNRAANIIARLQEKLGDSFDRDAPIPTSAELGFDMVQSMFEIGVTQRLEELSEAIALQSPNLAEILQMHTEIFLGLAESLQLPGFEAIARTTLTALERHPGQVNAIAQAALADFSQSRAMVLAGDRQQGGTLSAELRQLASNTLPDLQPAVSPASLPWEPLAVPNPLPIMDFATIASASPQSSPEAFTFKQNQCRSWRSTLRTVLQAKIEPGRWLQQFKNWITLQSTESHSIAPQPVTPSEPSATAPVPMLALEDLLVNLETPSFPPPESSGFEQVHLTNNAAIPPLFTETLTDSGFKTSDETDPWNQKGFDGGSSGASGDSTDAETAAAEQPPEIANSQGSGWDEGSDRPVADLNFSPEPVESEQNQFPEPVMPSSTLQLPTAEQKPAIAVPPPSVPNRSHPGGGVSSASVRVELDKLEKLNYLTGELLIHQNEQVNQEGDLRLMVQELQDRLQKHQQTLNQLCEQSDRFLLANRWTSNGKSTQETSSILQQFDELEMDRYSDIHILSRSALHETVELNAVSESIDQTTRQFRRSLETQQRLLFTVGNDLTAIRMQPLEELFQRLTQVIQQLSTSYNKPVDVAVTGTQVLVDKTIVDKLYDPLLHLVRNAFDHGIEHPEVRQSCGKPPVGRIEINAYHQGHHTVIEVRDDGPGIQLQRVAQRAVEMGWLSAEAIATTPQSTLLSFLFEPGFSTAAQVNDLSGRGVGLDVVRAQSDAFRGSVSVSFVPQQGTRFLLQIPLSLTIAKLLVCRDREVSYAFPLDAIEQIVSTPHSLTCVGQQRVLQWGKGDAAVAVAVRSLAELMEFAPDPNPAASDSTTSTSTSIVLLRTATGLLGIQIEQVIGEQELVIRPLGGAIAPPPYIYGCCIVGNSQLALVLDVRTLLKQENFSAQEQPYHSRNPLQSPTASVLEECSTSSPQSSSSTLKSSAVKSTPDSTSSQPILPQSKSRKPHHFNILLIEDSLTLRQTLSQLLQQAGYQVSQAKDGLEGLSFLQKHPGVDLILCDIEMPRMNGFEFLSQRRQYLSLAKIPVVMLTSRSSGKYRQFAMDLGAADFITKPYVDQNLLSTIQKLLVSS